MTPTLLLSLALAIAQPQQLTPIPPPPNAPKGMAPVLIYVYFNQNAGRIETLTYMSVSRSVEKVVEVKTSDGKVETKKVPVTITEAVPSMAPMDKFDIKIWDLNGKPVSYDDAGKKVRGGAIAVMVQFGQGQKLDALYLNALKEGTLVFEMPKPVVMPAPTVKPKTDSPKP